LLDKKEDDETPKKTSQMGIRGNKIVQPVKKRKPCYRVVTEAGEEHLIRPRRWNTRPVLQSTHPSAFSQKHLDAVSAIPK
jgi:hypothetical protein